MRTRAAAVALGALLTASCARGPEPGALAGWNVLLITIDTLRADRVGFAGYGAAETPVMDGLAERGVVFDNAVSAAPVTLPSHATILTGRYPPAHGALDNGFYRLPEGVPTLADVLRAEGYGTAAVIGAFVLHRTYGLAGGFDTYNDRFRRPPRESDEHRERRAGVVTDHAVRWLRSGEAKEPFFLWVHYFDPHAPYAPPGAWRARFATRPYDGEIAYTDEQVGRLLEALAAVGLAERTLVVLTSDHGEAMGEGGELTHGLLLRGATLSVPLVLVAPGVLAGGKRVGGLVSTADIAPSVLDLLGIAAPEGLDGTSLLPSIEGGRSTGRRAYSETRLPADLHGWSMLAGARDDQWAWVRGPIPELYDLEADPAETRNLHAVDGGGSGELDAFVGAVLERARPASPRESLSEEEEEALRALGYVASAGWDEPTGADPKEKLAVWVRVNQLREVLGRREFDEAVAGFEEVLRDDPGNSEARMLYAQALLGAGRGEEGLAEMRALYEKGAMPARAVSAYARALADAARLPEAEALLRSLAASEPQAADHPFNLGVLLAGQGRHEEALAAFEEAHRRNPEAVHVLANLAGELSRATGEAADPERAIRLIGRAVELSDDDDRPLLMKAGVLENLGREEEARALLRELAERRRLHGVTRQEVADALRRLG